MKNVNIKSIEVDGINTRDYPDFCDAYVSYAEYEDGTPLTDEEMDTFTNDNSDIVHELVMKKLY